MVKMRVSLVKLEEVSSFCTVSIVTVPEKKIKEMTNNIIAALLKPHRIYYRYKKIFYPEPTF